jgi:diguanylate cyclase (GGDEF)-like protein
MLLIDLDDFKRVNETEGQLAGDELLRAVGAMLPDLVDETDMCARIGGDEFAVLLDQVKSADEALQAAERVLSGLRRGVLLRTGVQPVRASAGVALADLSVKNAQDVLRDADVAMYTAKARRKGSARAFEPVMHKAMVERLQLETELERAVELAQLELHYQPIVSLVDGHVAAVETFVRWNHPDRGQLVADDFMSIAEETGLVVGIDRWVLLKACAQVREWQDRFPADEPLAVAVNLSLRQLESDHVVDLIRLALDVSRLAPQHLILELGEASMIREGEGTIDRLRALSTLGVRIALEDAGVGYASVSELREMPIDLLKINQSIIDGMGRSQEDDGIVAAILSLTDSLGLTSVAQGVERPDQSQQLAELHCDLAQGWHISRPLVEDELAALLQSRKAALNLSVFREALDEAVF